MLENLLRSTLTLKDLVYFHSQYNLRQCGGRSSYLDRTMRRFQFYHNSRNTAPYVNTLPNESSFISDFTKHVFMCLIVVQDTRVSKPIES